MKKTTTKLLSLALVLVIILGISAIPASAASNLAANPTASTVYVNGAAKAFEAYIINGNNYFKLRDLAYVLNGTAKQFEVGYDTATKAITLTTGRAYTPEGGEMARGDGAAKTAAPTASRIYLDGMELNLTVYLIGGNNFFKLRDLMEALDVFVGYDNATKAITLDTSKVYVPEASATPAPTPTPAPTQSASIDNEILGGWSYLIGTDLYTYQFNPDGTFIMILVVSDLISVEGTFFTSGGTVYLKNLVFEYRDTREQVADQESEYSFGSDEYGGYLMIKMFKYNDTVAESEPIHKFRRQ